MKKRWRLANADDLQTIMVGLVMFGHIMWIYNLRSWKVYIVNPSYLSNQNGSCVRKEGSNKFHWTAGNGKSNRGLKKKAQDVAKLEQVFRDIDETMQSVQQVF